MKSSFRGKSRPPLSDDQIKLLISMLDLLPDNVKDTSWINEERMIILNPGKKNVGRLVSKGIVEKKSSTEKLYRLSEDGRVIAKGMEALSRKMGR
jgi:predicted transcriptional regulator